MNLGLTCYPGGNGCLGDKYKRREHRVLKPDEAVVLIHGLWMPAYAMTPLAQRLRRRGWATVFFSYASRHATVKQNAAALALFVNKIDASQLHFVAHSLGGLVLAQYLQDFPAQRPGRVVLLGTPYRGSYVARHLNQYRLGRWLCGLSLQEALLGDGPRWPGGRELGVIAGTTPFGAGWLIPGLPRPNDGTVAVAETVVPGQTDNITLPVTHSGLLFSAVVVRQVAVFLADGRFSH
jgi:pimeloyl-ACP methyl ester carboxylesterase